MVPTLHIAKELRTRLESWAAAGYPLETCGLLVGSKGEGATRVSEVVRGRNLNTERAHDRYELDPEDLLAADKAARHAGLEIVGIWHTHPDHPARPSETDRAAAWEGWSYVIVSVSREGVQDFRSWRLNGEQFVEEAIEP